MITLEACHSLPKSKVGYKYTLGDKKSFHVIVILDVYVYVYIYIHTYICMYVYIYILVSKAGIVILKLT